VSAAPAGWHTTSAGEEVVARWWRGDYGLRGALLRAVLLPAEAAYRVAVGLRNAAYDEGWLATTTVEVPVVSVGNLTVGGTGKTPIAAWLVEELQHRGFTPALLHGGYATDEPALHRMWHPEVPVFAERDRLSGARRAIAYGADVLILDDGFQHRRMGRDAELLLLAAETWTRRPRLLPNGPWRESPIAMRRADLLIVTRKTATFERAQEVTREALPFAPGVPAAVIHLRPTAWRSGGGAPGAPQGPVLAVAGVAQPRLFAENAQQAGADVQDVLVFPDHHDYGVDDAARIRRSAAGRPVVTTAKDHVKLASLLGDVDLWILEQRVDVELGADAIATVLDGVRRDGPRP
jgi:tetraacyldisaccharide 4'-kinase